MALKKSDEKLHFREWIQKIRHYKDVLYQNSSCCSSKGQEIQCIHLIHTEEYINEDLDGTSERDGEQNGDPDYGSKSSFSDFSDQRNNLIVFRVLLMHAKYSISQFNLLRARVTEEGEGTERKVQATTGFITGQLMFLTSYVL